MKRKMTLKQRFNKRIKYLNDIKKLVDLAFKIQIWNMMIDYQISKNKKRSKS